MRIHRLLLSCGLLGVVGTLALTLASQQLSRSQSDLLQSQAQVSQTTRDVAELVLLTYEYVLHASPRVDYQWHKQQEGITRRLHELGDRLGAQPTQAQQHLSAMGDLFADLRDLQPSSNPLQKRRRDFMQQQLLANARELSQAIEQWNQLINASHTRSQQQLALLSVVIPLTLLVLLGVCSWLIWRRLLRPLAHLTQVVASANAGELHTRSELDGDDELGELSRAFDALALDMVAQLKSEVALRQSVEAAIRASEQRFRDLLNTMDGIVWEADASTFQITFISDQAERLLGYPCRDWLQPGFWIEHVHPDDRDWASDYCAQHTQRKEAHDFEYRFICQDGRSVWLHDVVTVVCENDQPRWLRGVMVDISRQKQDEAEIIAAKQHLQATLTALPDLLFEVDDKGTIYSLHAPNRGMLPVEPEQCIGRTFGELLPAATAHICLQAIDEARHFGTSQGMEYSLDLPQGTLWFEASVATLADKQSPEARFIFIARDITTSKRASEEIKNLAFFDALTQLPNRRLLLDRLNQARMNSARSEHYCALLLSDLDNFKSLNDTQGHDVGDQLLIEAANRFKSCLREGDTVARLGGDEFVVILNNLGNAEQAARQAERLASKIGKALGQPYELQVELADGSRGVHQHHCSLSIGISLFHGHDLSADELLKRADTAMYQAKKSGRNALRFFDLKMQEAVSQQARLENDLRRAVLDEQFELYYQIQVDAHDQPLGAEVLLRWHHPQHGVVSPADFIPLAEETGLILPLGHWVLRNACMRLAAWADDLRMAGLTLAVNVSPRQFALPTFVEEVLSLLEYTGANPARLKLELTESLLLENTDEIIAKMTQLKAHGVGFALDDFGTGYSSLSYLKRLPLDQLKIDQTFVRDLLEDPNDAAIARTVITLGQSMGLAVIAEGVECRAQRHFLADAGCAAYQGYLFGRPVPIDVFEQLISEVQYPASLAQI
ncbi:MAG: EAL domain-containing protein [Burkholderiaceae bacterium]|nr:MAG: EAL domain-containing protein [Burkholderiaceae bacterium]